MTDKILFGYVHPNTGVVKEQFAQSLANACGYAGTQGVYGGLISVTSANPLESRNKSIELFLTEEAYKDVDWFMTVDTDIAFSPAAPIALRDALIESGHLMGAMIGVIDTGHGFHSHAYEYDADVQSFRPVVTFPDMDARYEVDATGLGCNMFHRSVFEKLDPPWHRMWEGLEGFDGVVSHDLGLTWVAHQSGLGKILYCCDIPADQIESYPIGKGTLIRYAETVAQHEEEE